MLFDFIPVELSASLIYILAACFISLAIETLLLKQQSVKSYDIPLANPRPWYEPRLISYWRFAVNARSILESAARKYGGSVYRVSRGDLEMTIVPGSFLTELNALPQSIIDSRSAHSYNLTGHLNGVDVVEETSLHTRILQTKLTPALPELYLSIRSRISDGFAELLPRHEQRRKRVKLFDYIPDVIGRASSLVLVGTPLCDEAEFISLLIAHEKAVFAITFFSRLFPAWLQPAAVWLLPYKWQLERGMRRLRQLLAPEIEKRRLRLRNTSKSGQQHTTLDFLSWMVEQTEGEGKDDDFLLRLLGALIAGSTHSTANLVVNTMNDLISHPQYLAEIREEIRQTHSDVNGQWQQTTFDSLLKLDSAMQETMRMTPASLTAYSRFMQTDYSLTNGVVLKKDTMIAISSCTQQNDSSLYPNPSEYDAFRFHRSNPDGNQTRAFKSVDGTTLRWGAGRWACPGRFLATLEAKIVLVKLIDAYEFEFTGNSKLKPMEIHEFIFANGFGTLLYKPRSEALNLPW